MASEPTENGKSEEVLEDAEISPEDEAVEPPPEIEAEDVEAPEDDDDVGGHAHIWFLAAAFVTVIVMLAIIVSTRAWDAYLCDTNDDCRGIKECIEGHCVSPEVWQREQLQESQTGE